MGRRLARLGLPDHATISFHPLLPVNDGGTSGGTNGGAGAPPAAPPVAPPASTPPAAGAPAAVDWPANTPLAEMTIEQRLAYQTHWNRQNRTALEQREAELAQREAELAKLRPIGEQFAALESASRTEHERAVETARTEAEKAGREAGLAEARTTYGAQLVQAKLEAALERKGLTGEAMTALAGDSTRFIGAAGVDTAALDAFLAALPDKAAPVQLGGGRTTPVTATGTQAGIEAWNAAHPRKRTSA